jgi:phage FluMu protein Com
VTKGPDEHRREVRCCQCGKLLAKAATDAVRADRDVEIKCHSCNAYNYIRGRDEAA